MLANHRDSLAVLTPPCAATREPFTVLIAGTGLSMALLWTWRSGWIARHFRLEGPIRSWSPYLLPLILITVGRQILSDTVTDTFLKAPS